jgi:hypothetical protein
VLRGHSSPQADRLRLAPAPRDPVVRIARGLDPFAPPSWEFAQDDGTFGNRFDDPGATDGIPEAQRFRMLYCASQREAAFAEVLAHFRPSLATLAALAAIEDDEPSQFDSARVVIPADWRSSRRIGETTLDPSLRFVDLADPETVQILRSALAGIATRLGLPDVDLSALTGPHRTLTQHAARFIYDQFGGDGHSTIEGIHYLSRHNPAWACWAIFDQRLVHTPLMPGVILPDDLGLIAIARLFKFEIETLPGRYIR